MDKSKKIIIALIILLFIMGVIVIMIINYQNKTNIQNNNQIGNLDNQKNAFMKVNEDKTYYTIKDIINNYLVYMKEINGDTYVSAERLNMTAEELAKQMQDDGITIINNILDEQYKSDLNVNENQIKKLQNKFQQNGTYTQEVLYNLNINSILTRDIAENLTLALIDAKLNNNDFDLMIKLDKSNSTYSIFLEDYIKKYNYNENMNEKDININKKNIQVNEYNKYREAKPTESYIVAQYFSEFRMKMLYDTEEAFKLLDREYGQKKYESYEGFKDYVDANREMIEYASIKKYQVTEHEGLKEYVCVDENGKYYIFMEENAGKYKVVLDTYTIDLPEFLEKYNNEDGRIKVGMNIQKVFEAINNGDNKYVYNKLDETFRKNNFRDEADFDEYVKENFANNQLEYENCKKNGDLYMFDVTVTEGTESNEKAVRKIFIMRLLEGTDFVMSFNIE